MLLQSSFDAQISNLITIASTTKDFPANLNTAAELESAYRLFINKHYSRDLSNHAPGIRIVTEPNECAQLTQIFSDSPKTALDDLNQESAIEFRASADEQATKRKIIEAGINLLRVVSDGHGRLLDLIVTDIVILPSKTAYGGSTSDGLGIIWANPSLNWRSIDAAEFLVHELTHQCMFIDEICSRHYDYTSLLKPENWAQSAILKKLRPADKVLHSIVVAAEILSFRDLVGHPASPRAHPPSTKLAQQARDAVNSIKELNNRTPGILSTRANMLLETCTHIIFSEIESELEA